MLAPVRVAPPAQPLVSLAEAKLHLRVDADMDDTLIAGLVETATAHLDGWSGILGRALVTQEWRQDFCSLGGRMRLPLGPVSAATVRYVDRDEAEQVLAPSSWRLLTDRAGSYVEVRSGAALPSLADRPDAVRISFTCGYGGPADVPLPIRRAAKLLIGAWYENREATAIGVSVAALPAGLGVDALIEPFRRKSL